VLGGLSCHAPAADTGSFSSRTRELDRRFAGQIVWLDVHELYWNGRFYPEGPYEILEFSETDDRETVAIGLEYQGRLRGPFPERSIKRQALWWVLYPPALGRQGYLDLSVPPDGDTARLLESTFHFTPLEVREQELDRLKKKENTRVEQRLQATADSVARSPEELAREQSESERTLMRLAIELDDAREKYD
jgi:hypothetical protein